MTPRTSRPRLRARSASRPASVGSQPQRGSPTLTSTTTSPHTAGGRRLDGRVAVDGDRHPRAGAHDRAEPAGVEHLVGQQQVLAEAGRRHPLDLADRRAGEAGVPALGHEPGERGGLERLDVRPQPAARQRLGHRVEVRLEQRALHEQGRRLQLGDLHGAAVWRTIRAGGAGWLVTADAPAPPDLAGRAALSVLRRLLRPHRRALGLAAALAAVGAAAALAQPLLVRELVLRIEQSEPLGAWAGAGRRRAGAGRRALRPAGVRPAAHRRGRRPRHPHRAGRAAAAAAHRRARPPPLRRPHLARRRGHHARAHRRHLRPGRPRLRRRRRGRLARRDGGRRPGAARHDRARRRPRLPRRDPRGAARAGRLARRADRRRHDDRRRRARAVRRPHGARRPRRGPRGRGRRAVSARGVRRRRPARPAAPRCSGRGRASPCRARSWRSSASGAPGSPRARSRSPTWSPSCCCCSCWSDRWPRRSRRSPRCRPGSARWPASRRCWRCRRRAPATGAVVAPALDAPVEVAFRDVEFAYDDGVPVLRGATFTAPAGQAHGAGRPVRRGQVDGPGAGRALLRRRQSGAVCVGGADVRDQDRQELRSPHRPTSSRTPRRWPARCGTTCCSATPTPTTAGCSRCWTRSTSASS